MALFVKNKDGPLECEFIITNTIMSPHKNKYPLHWINDLFDQIQGSNYFSKISLRSRYHKHIRGEDFPQTTFQTRYGHYEFLMISFRVTNAPAAFMDLVNRVFQDYLDPFAMVLIDDMLIYS